MNHGSEREVVMNVIRHFGQSLIDGLVGAGMALLLLLLASGVPALFAGGSLMGAVEMFVEGLLIFTFLPRLFLYALLTAFVGTAIGGRFLERVRSRAGWILPLLGIGLLSWLAALGSITLDILLFGDPEFRDYSLYFMPTYASGLGVVALLSSALAVLLAVIVQPGSRLFKSILGAAISSTTGCALAFLVLIVQFLPT